MLSLRRDFLIFFVSVPKKNEEKVLVVRIKALPLHSLTKKRGVATTLRRVVGKEILEHLKPDRETVQEAAEHLLFRRVETSYPSFRQE